MIPMPKTPMMKKTKSLLGVTLLEVLLVLAIAAMIIVMSVRYYQSTSTSQQANTVLGQIQSITAAMDSLSQAKASYSGLADSTIAPLLPANGLRTPWGSTIGVSGAGGSFSVSIPDMPAAVCGIVKTYLDQNPHFKLNESVDCSGKGEFKYTYTSSI
ncbi:MAG TPA: hypothetical protein VHZ76_10825 [Gammaproteobacteria bacterium]|jgi:type II secretory pathway pseudopilin PulG|nr:hypothetical protein [Gammaproteobacteria bacterium]